MQTVFPGQWNRLGKCPEGEEGRKLFSEAGDQANSITPLSELFPWVFINDKYSDQHQQALKNLKQLICTYSVSEFI